METHCAGWVSLHSAKGFLAFVISTLAAFLPAATLIPLFQCHSAAESQREFALHVWTEGMRRVASSEGEAGEVINHLAMAPFVFPEVFPDSATFFPLLLLFRCLLPPHKDTL